MITEKDAREALSWVDALVSSQEWNRATHAKAQEFVMRLVQVVNIQFQPPPTPPIEPPKPDVNT